MSLHLRSRLVHPPTSGDMDGVEAGEAERRDRIRLVMAGLVLVTAAFAVSTGRILPDTKLDMPLNPAGFLGRALHMWDPSEYFGQVQNQAYGYFFPMGPFFLAGKVLGIAPWVVQRLWLGLVLCTAFYGLVKLAAALAIGTPNARLVAGFGYALAPRAQELLSANSSEFLPMAVLPWILLPLVHGSRHGSPRRAAALSALAVVCCGGINATAEAAVLAVPLLYLLTRTGGPRKRRLLGWWLGCTAAATLWWWAPTYLMGRYIFPFLEYTENAATTTSVTSLTNALRGTSQWLGFLPGDASPWWPAGHTLSTGAVLVVATAALAGAGLYGLAQRDLPERTFLVIALLLGVAIVVAGHASAVAVPFSGPVRDLLDGALAPFRNIHKFDALIRLPVVLGLCHLVRRPPAVRMPSRGLWRPTPAGLGAAALGLSLLPVLSPGLGPVGSPVSIPPYERKAADWLNRNTGEASVLAVPGQQFGEFSWGRVMDDPLQSLLRVRWANRMVPPAGSAGLARIMEAVDQRLATGQGSAGLTQVLARYGVRYLLVRNDIDRVALGSAYPARVHQAIDGSPGLGKVAEFGPRIRAAGSFDAINGVDQPFPALEVYQVPRPAPVTSAEAGRPIRVLGGPEAVLTLADQGLLPAGRPVLFNDDPGASSVPAADTIVTDTLRRREVDFADLRNGPSATMTADQPYTGASRVKDLTAPGWDRYQTVVRYTGITSVTASSSAADSTAIPGDGSRSQGPYAALDRDPDTAWLSSGWHGAAGEWLMVRLDRPQYLTQITAAFPVSDLLGPPVSEVSVETAAGTVRQRVRPVHTAQPLATAPGSTGWVRVRITRTASSPAGRIGTRAGISELSIPGVTAVRNLAPPSVAAAATLAFTGRTDATAPCMPGSHTWVCSPALRQRGEDGTAFDRLFTSPGAGLSMGLTGSAVLTDLGLIRRYTAAPGPAVTASSVLVEHPADDARSAFDGDPATTWIPDTHDRTPRLTITFGKTVELSRITFKFPYDTGAPPGVQVSVVGADGSSRSGLTGRKGRFDFAPMRTDRLVITFSGYRGIQISDLVIPGVQPPARPSAAPLTLGCGTGPSFTLGAQTIRTRLVGATPADLLAGRPVRYASCDPTQTGAGEQHLSAAPSSPFLIDEAVLSRTVPAASLVAAMSPMKVRTWGVGSRSVDVSGGGYLTTDENFNAGWTASLGGVRLRAVKVDGWRQAWVLPAGARGTVRMAYGPDRAYRWLLLAGLGLVLLVLIAAAVPGRSGPPPAGALRTGRRWRWPIAILIGFWMGGFIGLAVVPLACALGPRLRRGPLLSMGLLTLAGGLLAVDAHLRGAGGGGLPVGLSDAVPQVLCLIALGLLLGTFSVPSGPSAAARASRSPGG